MRLRTNPRTYTFSILSGLILLGLASMPAHAQNGKDSSFIKDNPIVARLDSLATLAFFNNNDFTTNRDVLNKYHFPVDSVPIYSDSVYRSRIDEMNQSSPFQFVYNDQTKAYIELYAYKKRKLISRMMGLAELYFPMFEEQLDIYNVPLEMKYLAIIESALNPIARSRVGASGLWQFMLGTGKLYGLNVTSYVDDRFDPYKSTVAACRHMRDLYNIYHDWALVLAAYNAGSGTVNRAIRLSGLDSTSRVTYWNIRPYLPVETQNYVPSFIGIAYIMSYPAEHNLYPSAPDYFYESVDTITLRKNYTLNQIASYLCIPVEQVQFLNPSYRKGIIPATASTPYVLRLPRAAMADFVNNQENIYAYKSAAEIQAAKDLAAASVIKPPVTNTTTTVTAQNNTTAPKPQTNTTVVKAPVPQQTQTTANNSSSYNKYVYHTVQRGDSLWSIAGRYKGASVDEIRRLNGLKVNSTIYPGQKLKIGITG